MNVCAHVQTRGLCQMSSSVTLLVFWDRVSHLTGACQFGSQAARELQGCPVLGLAGAFFITQLEACLRTYQCILGEVLRFW